MGNEIQELHEKLSHAEAQIESLRATLAGNTTALVAVMRAFLSHANGAQIPLCELVSASVQGNYAALLGSARPDAVLVAFESTCDALLKGN